MFTPPTYTLVVLVELVAAAGDDLSGDVPVNDTLLADVTGRSRRSVQRVWRSLSDAGAASVGARDRAGNRIVTLDATHPWVRLAAALVEVRVSEVSA